MVGVKSPSFFGGRISLTSFWDAKVLFLKLNGCTLLFSTVVELIVTKDPLEISVLLLANLTVEEFTLYKKYKPSSNNFVHILTLVAIVPLGVNYFSSFFSGI